MAGLIGAPVYSSAQAQGAQASCCTDRQWPADRTRG